MLNLREKGMILYIIQHCKRIESKLPNSTRTTLDENEDITEIICFNILQIGELAKGLSDEFVMTYKNVPWKNIKRMCDKVAHGYGTINLDQIWKAASEDIKPLREYCERILKENNN